jgi:uncharacterized protein
MSTTTTARISRRSIVRAGASSAAILGLLGCASWQAQKALRPTQQAPGAVLPDFPGYELQVSFLPLPQPSVGQIQVWWLAQPAHQHGKTPTLLYCHGTLRNLWPNAPKILAWLRAGFSVLALDYRGWGHSTSIPVSEATITQDTALAWQHLTSLQSDPAQRVIYGHSMGSSAAVTLASSLPASEYRALMLESAFDRINSVASEAGLLASIIGLASVLEFDSLRKIPKLTNPLLSMHGLADTTVPWKLGRKLFDASAAKQKMWCGIEGGTHSQLHREQPDLYAQAVQWFLNLPAN